MLSSADKYHRQQKDAGSHCNMVDSSEEEREFQRNEAMYSQMQTSANHSLPPYIGRKLVVNPGEAQ